MPPKINIDKIVTIAMDAGKLILDIYQQDSFSQRLKSDDSPLTEADTASHNFIVQQLQEITPSIPILSEEASDITWDVRRYWDCYWLIDPLDGTKEFIKRNGEFTVNISLVYHHEPVLGVVHAPVFDTTWVGEKGKSAVKIQSGEQQNISVNLRNTNDTWKVVGSRTHAGNSLEEFLADLKDYELIPIGSSIKLCLVAEGKADIYPRLGPTSEWDTAAAHAVVNAAGGEVVIAENKKPLLYNTKDSLLNPHFLVRPVL